eukprot:6802307-Pyramimonas_sp.AAC.1
MEGRSFSNCGFRFSAAHMFYKHVQELRGLRVGTFQHVALASVPRTSVLNIFKSFTDSPHQRTRNGVTEGIRIMLLQQSCWFSVLKS